MRSVYNETCFCSNLGVSFSEKEFLFRNILICQIAEPRGPSVTKEETDSLTSELEWANVTTYLSDLVGIVLCLAGNSLSLIHIFPGIIDVFLDVVQHCSLLLHHEG